MGGFECSTHKTSGNRRVDVIASSRHDLFAKSDYELLLERKMFTARDGVRWHLIETEPYRYDFSSVADQIRAARETGIQIIWDLFHYGFPDDLNIFSGEFVERFAAFAAAFTEFLIAEDFRQPLLCLVNEISFFAWAAGEVGFFYPFAKRRGDEMKRNLVRATIAAAKKIREISPDAFLIQTDPVIRVTAANPKHKDSAADYHNSQFHALDMLLGKAEPEIGGDESVVDMIGVNYYPYNQWRHPSGRRVFRGHKNYQPFGEILREFYARYQKPIFIAETGTEDDARGDWFKYICDEVRRAENAGVPVSGVCLYPILNHPGWDDDRHCHNGLWDYADESGKREIYEPLAAEVRNELIFRENRYNV